jgi:hypothetical protein
MARMVESVLNFEINAHTGSSEYYIDIAQCMSAVNRKLYRQHGQWQVLAVNAFAQGPSSGGIPFEIAIGGAPRTWTTRNALEKCQKAWLKQQRSARKNMKSVKPKWEDFKVWLNSNHRATGNLLPTSGHPFGGTDPVNSGEWTQSLIVVADPQNDDTVDIDELALVILGANNRPTYVGIIEEYGDSRSVILNPDPDNQPNMPYTIYSEMEGNSQVDEEVLENMDGQGDQPPYDPEEYLGAAVNGNEPQCFAYGATTATLGHKLNLNGFMAPNGLLEIQANMPGATDPSDLWIQLVIGQRSDY